MNRYTWTENGFTFKRINKAQARRAYNNGLRVVVCPVNLRPGYPFHPEISVSCSCEEVQKMGFLFLLVFPFVLLAEILKRN